MQKHIEKIMKMLVNEKENYFNLENWKDFKES
jgi:hypothetical protein